MATIMIVEDEQAIVLLLKYNLEKNGYETITVSHGNRVVAAVEKYLPSLILLDWMLPEMSGLELCKIIRNNPELKNIPIIMLTAKSQEEDKVIGLSAGADDYVTKPFSVLELTARVDALVRRLGLHSFTTETIQSGEFCLDMRARELKKNGKRVDLTQVEFSLMKTFLENRGRAMDREELLGAVWGKHYSGELKIVDVNIRRLRIKVEDDPASPRHITTVRGFGYMWKD